MKLILQIAAGVIIGFLAVQIFLLKYISYSTRNEATIMRTVQDLHTKTVGTMNAVDSFYREHGRLPGNLSDIRCTDQRYCAMAEKDGTFYMTENSEWMSATPYVNRGKVDFYCKISLAEHNEDKRFDHCTKLDISTLPDFGQMTQ